MIKIDGMGAFLSLLVFAILLVAAYRYGKYGKLP